MMLMKMMMIMMMTTTNGNFVLVEEYHKRTVSTYIKNMTLESIVYYILSQSDTE
jgi:hypothetical protein